MKTKAKARKAAPAAHISNASAPTPQPCPSCGHCPTCGRSASPPAPIHVQPWWQWPYQWTWTTGGITTTTTTAHPFDANVAIPAGGWSFSITE